MDFVNPKHPPTHTAHTCFSRVLCSALWGKYMFEKRTQNKVGHLSGNLSFVCFCFEVSYFPFTTNFWREALVLWNLLKRDPIRIATTGKPDTASVVFL